MSRITSTIIGFCIISFPFLYSISDDILANELTSLSFVLLLLLVMCTELIYGLLKKTPKIISINIVDILIANIFFYCSLRILADKEWENDKYLIYKWGAVILCYLFFRNYHYSKTNLLIACCISGIFQSIIAICQKNGLIASHNLVFDVTGSFSNPGPLGGYIAICCSITMGLLYHKINNGTKKVLYFLSIGLFIQLYGLYLTESRAGIISLIPICLIWVSNPLLMKKAPKKNRYIIISLILIVGSILMYQNKPASADGRLLIWRVSTEMITDAPLFGHGPNGFSKEYMIYQANYFKENPNSHFISVADNVIYPFNEYIHIWIKYGIIALLLVILLLCYIFVICYNIKQNKIINIGLSSLMIFSLFSYPFDVFPLLLFFPLLCGLMHSKIYYNLKITNSKSFFMILAIAIFSFQTYNNILFTKEISNSLSKLYKKDSSDINHTDYEKIKGNTNFNDYYSTWLMQQPKTMNQRIKDMYPSCETYCLLGSYYAEHNNYILAEYYFQEASFMIPSRLKPKYRLWELYKERGQYEKALKMANSILTMKPKIESIYTLRMKRKIKDFYKHETPN